MKIFILEYHNIRKLNHSSEGFSITFDDLKEVYDKKGLKDKNVSPFKNFLWRVKYRVENWSKDFQEYLNFISNIVNDKIKELNKITSFFYDKEKLISDMLDQEELDDDVFPFPLYISANKSLYDDVGLMIFKEMY